MRNTNSLNLIEIVVECKTIGLHCTLEEQLSLETHNLHHRSHHVYYQYNHETYVEYYSFRMDHAFGVHHLSNHIQKVMPSRFFI